MRQELRCVLTKQNLATICTLYCNADLYYDNHDETRAFFVFFQNWNTNVLCNLYFYDEIAFFCKIRGPSCKLGPSNHLPGQYHVNWSRIMTKQQLWRDSAVDYDDYGRTRWDNTDEGKKERTYNFWRRRELISNFFLTGDQRFFFKIFVKALVFF